MKRHGSIVCALTLASCGQAAGECVDPEVGASFTQDELIAGEGLFSNCRDSGPFCDRTVIQCFMDAAMIDVVAEYYFEGDELVATWEWTDVETYCGGSSYDRWTGFVVEESCRP